MSEERRGYRYDRVLIESDRILSPQFHDAVVFLSGAQLELLRNMTQYLSRLDTYVSEYNQDYYLTPDASDYDAILAIVADLEETIMGNPNTIFGFAELLDEPRLVGSSGAGDVTIWFPTVPEGELWRVEAMHGRNETSVNTRIRLDAVTPAGTTTLHEQDNPAIDEQVVYNGIVTLEVGSACRLTFYGCTLADVLRGGIRGYKMVLPD